jgi:hypothetical protein
MSRVSLTLRMLVLLPLLAAGVDLTRATAACGTGAQTCLEAAGRGWLGPVAVLLVVVYAAGAGLLLARHAGRRPASGDTGFLRLWALATTGLVVTTAGQDVVARLLGGDSARLGGTPLGVLALCVAAGALLALARRVAGDAAELISVRAPGLPPRALAVAILTGRRPEPVAFAVARTTRGRAPPAA